MSADSWLCGSDIQERRLAYTLSLHPRLGSRSEARHLDDELTRMIIEGMTYSPKQIHNQLFCWFQRDSANGVVESVTMEDIALEQVSFIVTCKKPIQDPCRITILYEQIKPQVRISIGKYKDKEKEYRKHMDLPSIVSLYESLRVCILGLISHQDFFDEMRRFLIEEPPPHTQVDMNHTTEDGLRVISAKKHDKDVIFYDNEDLGIVRFAYECSTYFDILFPADVQDMKNRISFFFQTDYSTFWVECGLSEWMTSQLRWSVIEVQQQRYQILDSGGTSIGVIDLDNVIKVVMHKNKNKWSLSSWRNTICSHTG